MVVMSMPTSDPIHQLLSTGLTMAAGSGTESGWLRIPSKDTYLNRRKNALLTLTKYPTVGGGIWGEADVAGATAHVRAGRSIYVGGRWWHPEVGMRQASGLRGFGRTPGHAG